MAWHAVREDARYVAYQCDHRDDEQDPVVGKPGMKLRQCRCCKMLWNAAKISIEDVRGCDVSIARLKPLPDFVPVDRGEAFGGY